MSYFKQMAFLAILGTILFSACNKDGAIGSTIASQVTGTFVSTQASVIVDEATVVDASSEYMMTVTEVDANTVSVITDHANAFEVDLSKSDDGLMTTGKTKAGISDFEFKYSVADRTLKMNYKKDGIEMSYEGSKE